MKYPPLTRFDLKEIRELNPNSREIGALLSEIRRLQLLLIEVDEYVRVARSQGEMPYLSSTRLVDLAVAFDKEWFIRWDRAVQEKKKKKSNQPNSWISYYGGPAQPPKSSNE